MAKPDLRNVLADENNILQADGGTIGKYTE